MIKRIVAAKIKTMKLNEVKKALTNLKEVNFQLPEGTFAPSHFHITEVGSIKRNFIDCGGTLRKEEVINFQLWEAEDYDHRLAPGKLLNIIELSEKALDLKDISVEVEYQSNTIGRYDLDFNGSFFVLLNKQTDCLAKDKCGVPDGKVKMATLGKEEEGACTPGGGCC
jgi:hypothetical protein